MPILFLGARLLDTLCYKKNAGKVQHVDFQLPFCEVLGLGVRHPLLHHHAEQRPRALPIGWQGPGQRNIIVAKHGANYKRSQETPRDKLRARLCARWLGWRRARAAKLPGIEKIPFQSWHPSHQACEWKKSTN